MLATITIVAGLFSSCSQVVPSAQDADQEVPVISELRGVTFKFALPGQDAHIVDTRVVHDIPEWKIDELWLYEFDREGAILMADPIDIASALSGGSNEPTYTYNNPKWGHGEVRQFYFVANTKIDLKKGDTMERFQEAVLNNKMEKLSSDVLTKLDPADQDPAKSDQYRIPMTGIAKQNGNQHIVAVAGYPVEVKLIRAVARIDVINRLPEFKITKLELFNANESSFVHNDYDFTKEVKVFERISAPVPSFKNLGDGIVGLRDGTAKISKAFYLYETYNEDVSYESELTKVRITASYKGKEGLLYEIPFVKRDEYGEISGVVNVRRNHLYTIVVGSKEDPTGANVSFALKDEPWTVHQMDDHFGFADVSGENIVQIDDFNYELTADPAAKSYTLTVSFNYVPTTEKLVVDYISDWITNAELNNKTLTFDVTPNDTGKERIGYIDIHQGYSDYLGFSITVKQSAQ